MKKRIIGALATVAVAATLAVSAAVPANAGIKLWSEADYQGYLGDFGTGTSYVGSGADDKATSLQVTSPANYAILYQLRDYGGCYTGRFYVGYDNLASTSGYAVYGGCVGFNNRTSSIG